MGLSPRLHRARLLRILPSVELHVMLSVPCKTLLADMHYYTKRMLNDSALMNIHQSINVYNTIQMKCQVRIVSAFAFEHCSTQHCHAHGRHTDKHIQPVTAMIYTSLRTCCKNRLDLLSTTRLSIWGW